MNAYLAAQRSKFDALRTSIEGLQTRATDEKRDLTDEELRSVTEQAATAKTLAEQIESLTDVETRNRKVADLAGQVADAEQTTETRMAATTTKERDPGHYRSEKQGGQHSFFGDIYRSRANGDEEAGVRLKEHHRALTTGAAGAGIVPPHWLTEEFELLARQGRRLANVVRQIPLGDDPRPLTLPRQTAGTDAVVAQQATENTAVGGADAWTSAVDTVVPKPIAGKQTVSRQMIDMSTPAIDQLIYGDLMASYNQVVETTIGAALVTAAGAAVTTFATEAAFSAAQAAGDSVIDLAIAVRNARKLPADVLAMPVERYGRFLKLKDTTNRPLIPLETAGPMNVLGVGDPSVDGRIAGLGVVATDGIPDTYPKSYLAFRAMDQILFESNVLRFRFEEVAGPESIVLGVWAYVAFISRQATKSVKRAVVTAA